MKKSRDELTEYQKGQVDALRQVYNKTKCEVTEEFIEELLREIEGCDDDLGDD